MRIGRSTCHPRRTLYCCARRSQRVDPAVVAPFAVGAES
jgi:hypothetical protein